jgi:hypothetical protein
MANRGFIARFEKKQTEEFLTHFQDSPFLANSEMDIFQTKNQVKLDVKLYPAAYLRLLRKIGKGNPKLTQMPKSSVRADKLAKIFNKYGSDKANPHSYHLIYGEILKSVPTRILEVGIGSIDKRFPSNMGIHGFVGASLYAWNEIYPNAKIYGADIDTKTLFNTKNISTYYVDQTNYDSLKDLRKRLEKLCGGKKTIDLIIDDGLHSPLANILTFTALSDLLKKGGYFVIEDINISALDIWFAQALTLGSKYKTKIFRDKDVLVFVARKI